MDPSYNQPRQSVKEKIMPYLQGKYALTWLFLISFSESSFFPVPPDFFQLPMTVRRPERWKQIAFIVTFASILGAVFGYVIGALFFEYLGRPLIDAYNLGEKMSYVKSLFDNNVFWTMFIAAFTPLPFKVFTLSAGLFRVDIVSFLVASALGRGMRFFAVGYLSKWFGVKAGHIVFRHFNIFTLAFGLVVVVYATFQFVR
ncbi:MAG: cytochrome B [Parcubacteria group bacterium CG11_big_fil_rev_8_21_14_0_20_39_22]|nr:MAG: cytochrome B [Parcubacteria group bacterium CG11_big_fil_rev_8_21_14_0_20_39_22]